MSLTADSRALLGLRSDHLQPVGSTGLLPAVCTALEALVAAARDAGYDLCVASAHRDFSRQLAIWNGKLSGERPVTDDHDRVIDMAALPLGEQLHCVLRFSALPGASRHHWGTDLDVFDAAAMPDGYRLQLSQSEVADDGIFGSFHCWLDERIASGESFGFYRPYGSDRGGVATERWHLSYAPLARAFQRQLTPDLIREGWNAAAPDLFLCRDRLEADLEELLARYVQRVDEPNEAALAYAG